MATTLILGPFRPGSILQVSQPQLTLVLTARIVALVLCAVIAGLWLGLRRRASGAGSLRSSVAVHTGIGSESRAARLAGSWARSVSPA